MGAYEKCNSYTRNCSQFTKNKKGLVKIHFDTCGEVPLEEHVQISGIHKGEKLLTLEAVYIHELQQTLNSKDEYRSRTSLTLIC